MSNAISIAASEETVYIRVTGIGNMHNAYSLYNFMSSMNADGARKFFLDMSLCTGLDSTFMGLLVGFASQSGEGDKSALRVVNASEKIIGLLDQLGASSMIDVDLVTNRFPIPEWRFDELNAEYPDTYKKIEFIRDMHRHLVEINDENQKRFGQFLDKLTNEFESRDKDE